MSSRRVLLVLSLALLCGCSGGGGSSTAVAAWEKFRHDTGNTGQGDGIVASTHAPATPHALSIDGMPISSSPAIGLDGTVYVATEGGTLAAVDPNTLAIKWTKQTCEACPSSPSNQQKIGPLVASPAVFTLNTQTTVLIGSESGQLVGFTDNGTNNPMCTLCFQPSAADPTIVSSEFIASPLFVTNATTNALATIFAAASVEVTQANGTQTVGKLYALNSDGSLQWQFPRPGDPQTISPITASPVLGLGGTLQFVAGDTLNTVGTDGAFLWSCTGATCGGFPFGAAIDPGAQFASSPAVSSLTYVATAAGVETPPTTTDGGAIFAIAPDGSFIWKVASPDGSGFIGSVAVGILALTTPTPTPTVPITPTLHPGEVPTATPTPTPTILPLTENVFAVTKAGTVVVIDAATGLTKTLTTPLPAIAGPVISSPALSNDAFLVFGSADGKLYAVDTATGESPNACVLGDPSCAWPVQLTQSSMPQAIRSSPAIASNGTIFVGADDGNLYAIATQ
ncbi:MAG: PQQ-binding-like beta-propeller repeat protein [Candidatus Binatia bacterium]